MQGLKVFSLAVLCVCAAAINFTEVLKELEDVKSGEIKLKWNGREVLCNCTDNCLLTSELNGVLSRYNLFNVCVGYACLTKRGYYADGQEEQMNYGCIGMDGEDSVPSEKFLHCSSKGYETAHCCNESFCTSNLSIASPNKDLALSYVTASPTPLAVFIDSRYGYLLGVPLFFLILLGYGVWSLATNRRSRSPRNNCSPLLEEGCGKPVSKDIGLISGLTLSSTISESDDKNVRADYSLGSGSGPIKVRQPTLSERVIIHSQIASGRFGTVFAGELDGQRCAVKIFDRKDESSFYREINMFENLQLRHPNILMTFGYDVVTSNHGTRYWLLTEFHTYGSIAQFFLYRTVALPVYIQMVRSIASGLSYLHIALHGGKEKPRIAHRDIKRQNLLVKKDLTIVIGDLGLSACDDGSYYSTCENKQSGTIRYLAPEILDNTAGTSFDALLYADMYSYGLVMWEMACKIRGFRGVPEFTTETLAYHHVGRDPDIPSMRKCVCETGFRPHIYPSWLENDLMAVAVECMRDCWSPDGFNRPDATSVRRRFDHACRSFDVRIEM